MDWNSRYIAEPCAARAGGRYWHGRCDYRGGGAGTGDGTGQILTRQTLVCAGLPIAEKVSVRWIPEIRVTRPHNDGHLGTCAEIVQVRGKRPRDPDRRANRVELSGTSLRSCHADAALCGTTRGDENADPER